MNPTRPFRLSLAAAALALAAGGVLLYRRPHAAHAQSRPLPPAPVMTPEEAAARTTARAYRLKQRRVYYTAFNQGDPDRKLAALTFDDGPDPTYTPQILDILKREHVPATFFIIGSKAEKHPELIRREAAEGHDLGNHTYHHLELTQLNDDGLRFEIERTNQALTRILGGPTRWFRAPGCHYTARALRMIHDLKMVRVDTSANSGDWARYGVGPIMRRTLSHLSPGDIILCHDRVPETVEALPKLIAAIRKRGYRFVTLADLALRSQADVAYQPPYWPGNEGITIEGAPRNRTVKPHLLVAAGHKHAAPSSLIPAVAGR
jgi:peptidoglycan/xylan/chitin deacetylase (PgdA/CDA1 family)